jgi:hypothetical protein
MMPTRSGSPLGAAPVEAAVDEPVDAALVAVEPEAAVLLDFLELPQPATNTAPHTASAVIKATLRLADFIGPPSL